METVDGLKPIVKAQNKGIWQVLRGLEKLLKKLLMEE